MADFATIKSKIVAIVQADTDLDESGQVFQYEPEIAEVTKDPYAVVIASGNQNDFGSVFENKRTYGFMVRIYVERKSRGASAAETLLQSIIDRLIDEFDQAYTLTNTVLISRAAPSTWGYILGDKEFRTAEIAISAKTWFDVTA